MMVAMPKREREAVAQDDDLRLFLLVLRRALLMVVHYIEARYQLRERRPGD